MRTDLPQSVSLAEYAPYPFAIDTVRLAFDLDPKITRVTARLAVRRTGPGPLRLDGVDLELEAIALDGAPLAEGAYTLDETGLTLAETPDAFELETRVRIAPAANTALSGLYMSGGRYCTQCEAEGFRRITFWPDRPDVMSRFHVRIEADAADCPFLLSNGTPGQAGGSPGGRRFAEWDDPHPKPSYLFALCAGDYDVYRDTFTTMGGRRIDLAIHVDKGDADRAEWAMDCLKRSMRWDETEFGREYDLGVFNIVAVRDFNFGAMENKGLNVFNSAYVLADPETANDQDFEAIESIVAHEYFHNWTGNRITCRDWFQLCLKEGLTVFRDQEFSADQRSRPVQRIKDVIRLRGRQFAEDAGPLAHPVRPDAYASIDNLYTATVYEKGAELIRMLKRLIGEPAFAKGMDLYFDRLDGTAATIEDFYSCFEAASGEDLSAFRHWYAQAGTPTVSVEETWTPGVGLSVKLSQRTPPTPGETEKRAVPIPLACALLDGSGGQVETEGWPGGERLVVLKTDAETLDIELPEGAPRPILSINRGFTAPIKLQRAGDPDPFQRIAVETDPFNRWDAAQSLVKASLLSGEATDPALLDALAAAGRQAVGDPAYAALLLRAPDVGELFQDASPADPAALKATRDAFQNALSIRLSDFIDEVLDAAPPKPFRPDAEQAGIRALRAAAVFLLASQGQSAAPRIARLFETAEDMTSSLSALRALATVPGAEREAALSAFYDRWKRNPLIIDKWFAAQAAAGSADDALALTEHPAFDLKNPNRVRSVAAVFAMQNLPAFHAPDGAGHGFVADLALKVDPLNPALAARLLTSFEQWRRLADPARGHAEAALRRLEAAGLSKNAEDIVARSLA